MPRQARLIVPDITVHIVQRGHNRRDCFLEQTDYLVYLANLRDLTRKTGCALHAYCLMTNHVHLLVTPSTAQACGLLMRNLGQRYVQYFNRRYRRTGTLWEGRYKSCLVLSAQYVLACYRYIERNPVRAGMVASVPEYPWSSHGGNSGRASNVLLTPHAEYLAMGTNDAARLAAYADLLASADDPAFLASIRDATEGGFALVDESSKSRVPAASHARLERKRPGRRPQSVAHEDTITLDLGLRPRSV